MRTYHLTFVAKGRQPPFPGEVARRAAVRALIRVGGAWIVLFCLVDDHVHVVVLCEPADVRRIARSLHMTLTPRASVPLLDAHVEPVEKRSHMEWLVRYVVGQVDHHALHAHPALWSGSCFADLVGARVLPGWRANIDEALPRHTVADALKAAGLDLRALEPIRDAGLRELGVRRIVSAAADAVGADPALPGRTAEVVEARRVAITLARGVDFDRAEIAHALGLTVHGVAKLARTPASPECVAAARVRLGIEVAVAATGSPVASDRAMVKGRRAESTNPLRSGERRP